MQAHFIILVLILLNVLPIRMWAAVKKMFFLGYAISSG